MSSTSKVFPKDVDVKEEVPIQDVKNVDEGDLFPKDDACWEAWACDEARKVEETYNQKKIKEANN